MNTPPKILFGLAFIALVCTTTNALSQSNQDNWLNPEGTVWRSGDGELCWRNSYWTPDTSSSECAGATCRDIELPPPTPEPASSDLTEMLSEPARPPSFDIFFAFDQDTLTLTAKQTLDELLNRIAQSHLEVIVLTGYTDTSGTAQYNMKLSYRRAESVKAYLVSKGIPANRIYVESNGMADPIATNKTREGRAQNRRVKALALIYQ